MFLIDSSVRRPVAMCCLIIALTLLGLNSYRKIGLELMPRVDIPYITVVTVYPGASPSDIETDVAKRIEDAVSSVDGLKHVTSSCMENVCQTVLEFHLEVDVNVAATDVREKIDLKLSEFPAGVEKPVIMKFDINAKPIATLALTGDLSVEELYDYADDVLRDRLSVITGVANVELLGGSAREVHVLLDRKTLAAAGLTSMQVAQALQGGMASLPAGRVREHGTEYAVRFDAEYDSVKEIGSLQVAGRDGARRYLRDLGSVTMAAEERRQAAFVDGRPCVGIRVVKKADANAVEVVEDVRKAVERLGSNLPGGMELVWVTDDGQFVKAAVDNTTGNIWTGVLLTAAILFFFLFDFRSTFVVAITMPLTIVVSLFFVHLLGFTLNISTLLAMGLSVGMLVTNSIIVLESIVSHLQKSGNPWTAARDGTAEVAVAVLASAGTNVVVLFPIAMMGSMVGLMFKPFAWTMLIVNVVSLFISFTLTPLLSAVLLKAARGGTAKGTAKAPFLSRLERRWSDLLGRAVGRYVGALRSVARRRWLTVALLCMIGAIFAHAMSLAPRLGFSFVSETDRGEIYVRLEYPTRLELAQTVDRVRQVEADLRDLAGLQHIFTSVGKAEGILGQSSEGVHLALILLKFSDKTEREFGLKEMLGEVRRRLAAYPDCIVTAAISDVVGGLMLPIELEIAGENFAELDRIALTVKELAEGVEGIVGPDTSVRESKPELQVVPRRAVLADIGAQVQGLGVMLRANLEGIKAATFKSGARTYDVRVKLAEEPGKRQVADFQLPAGLGSPVALSNYTDIHERRTAVQITRSDKSRVSKVFANLGPDTPVGTAVKRLDDAIQSKGILPAGYTCQFRGAQFEAMEEGMAALLEAGILAVLLTYLMLAAVLESFRRPFLILTTVPISLVGIVWALYVSGQSISIFVLLGAVMLVGIVVNIAVLILDRMQMLRAKGVEPAEAMLQALAAEFRAVLMVTLAAILGMLPLALASGLGSELTVSIGLASVGGIVVSAVLALLVIPLLFLLFFRPRFKV